MNTDETKLLRLRELAQQFRVCWKTWPEYAYVGDEKRQVGYALELAGSHEPWVEHADPGCAGIPRFRSPTSRPGTSTRLQPSQ